MTSLATTTKPTADTRAGFSIGTETRLSSILGKQLEAFLRDGEGIDYLFRNLRRRMRPRARRVAMQFRPGIAQTAGPVATIHLPVRVPFGFHGGWAPGMNAIAS